MSQCTQRSFWHRTRLIEWRYPRFISNTIPRVQKNFQTEDCLKTALASSEIRTHARSYTRQRMLDQKEANSLIDRDVSKYGMVPDLPFMVGKYGNADKEATCKALISGAQKTNWFYNFWAYCFG
jgi:hypothetical protein